MESMVAIIMILMVLLLVLISTFLALRGFGEGEDVNIFIAAALFVIGVCIIFSAPTSDERQKRSELEIQVITLVERADYKVYIDGEEVLLENINLPKYDNIMIDDTGKKILITK